MIIVVTVRHQDISSTKRDGTECSVHCIPTIQQTVRNRKTNKKEEDRRLNVVEWREDLLTEGEYTVHILGG